MTLPLPDLDDRRWDDLVAEGRALIPVHAPEWTDHNVHDPGITLIELFAWIAETDVYQLNRVPAARHRKFLALAGFQPRAPRGARAAIAFELANGAVATPLPAGLEIEGDGLAGAPIRFRTRRGLTAVAGSLESVQVRSGDRLVDLTDRRRRGAALALLGPDPRPGTALYLGLRLPAGPAAEAVSFYFRLAGNAEDQRRRLLEEARRARRACLAPPSLTRCDDGEPEDHLPGQPGPDEILVHHSAKLAWEVHVGGRRWRTLEPAAVRDATRALTLSGPVEVDLPAAMVPLRLGPVEHELYYLRCRLLTGAFDVAPEAAAVLLNGVEVEQVTPIVDENLGQGTGRPEQQARLRRPLVAAPEVELTTLEEDGPRRWSQRFDFVASGRRDSHFVVDRQTGDVTFGDGEHGRVAPAGASITASYRSTHGAAGNLEAGSLKRLADTPDNRALIPDFDALAAATAVRQPLAAAGGSPGETLDQAASRAFEEVATTPRAVTLADFEERARQTPGTRLARVAARANLHPAFPCFRAPGVVTVIIVPHLPARRPVPSAGLRRTVAAYLRRRKTLGTRVEVVGPCWVEVAVRTRVRACAGTGAGDLEARLRAALDRFFDPLTGGPEGGGWPFGRDVYRSEILQALDETPGVDHVLALELIDGNGNAACGNLCVPACGLVAAAGHDIEIVGARP